MLHTISQLGTIKSTEKTELKERIKHIIGMHFDVGGKYVKTELNDYDPSDSWKYLYQPTGGRLGLFLTGNLALKSIKDLAKVNTHDDFAHKKILGLLRSKLLTGDLYDTLNEQRQQELTTIFKELRNKIDTISHDVISKLTSSEPQPSIITIMIDNKYLGEFQDYSEFFNRGRLASRGTNEQLVCNVCNKLKEVYPFTERTLPFFYMDKLHFFHENNVTRSFPTCLECYESLQRGTRFIADRLNYIISSNNKLIPAKKGKGTTGISNIRFWLVPYLQNPEVIGDFKHDLESHNKRLYYLDSLKMICSSLEVIGKLDNVEDNGYADAFLRFSALFYYNDSKAAGIMRILQYVSNIYPPQLKKLVALKQQIDSRFPFQFIKKQKFAIGFPLLVEFYKDITPRWDTHVIGILNKMFTGEPIQTGDLIKNINLRVHQTLRYSKDLTVISRTVLNGLMLVEYVGELNNNTTTTPLTTTITMLNISTYETRGLNDFIESHKSVLNTNTKQGIFATGVAVAFLFHEQEIKYEKTPPFWDKLSRLDLTLQKVMSLTTEVKRLLGAYKIRKHDTIINYIAMKCTAIDQNSDISKDLVSFIFTTGLGFGYFLARENIVKVGDVIRE